MVAGMTYIMKKRCYLTFQKALKEESNTFMHDSFFFLLIKKEPYIYSLSWEGKCRSIFFYNRTNQIIDWEIDQ